ncbi:MAG: FeoC-like transcriptional regulator [Anaerolineales bacterium]|nr:FeoC-like transcriptional regulator [Anaerolineales bacterium]
MLAQILSLLEQYEGGLGAREIGRQLRIQPGALEGMLELLVRKGRLVKLCAAQMPCGDCPLRSGCNLLSGRNTRYVLARRS